VVTVGSLPKLHKINTLVIGTLHFVGARFCCNNSHRQWSDLHIDSISIFQLEGNWRLVNAKWRSDLCML
jgi:hypothetical protein